MEIDIRVDTAALEVKLHELAKFSRTTPGQVIREETRLLVENIMKLTPPLGKSAKASSDGKRVSAHAQGRGAIPGDLSRIVYGLDASKTKWKPLQRAVETKNHHAIDALMRNKRAPQFTYVTSAAEIERQHKKLRNNRGRIPRGVRPRLAALQSVVNSYVRKVQENVGWHKAAFVSALLAAGGRSPAGWIARHAARAGSASVNFGENPSVVAIAGNVKIPGFQRVVDSALAQRVKITERKIQRLISGKATNLGFVTILERK